MEAGIAVTLPKPKTSGAKADGRFGKQDFVYLPEQDVYRCPAGEMLKYHYTNVEHGMELRRYWTAACRPARSSGGARPRKSAGSRAGCMSIWSRTCSAGSMRTPSHAPGRETVEHPFGTIKARMGATHFLMKRCPVAGEMALHVLAYNLTRVMNIVGGEAGCDRSDRASSRPDSPLTFFTFAPFVPCPLLGSLTIAAKLAERRCTAGES